MKIFTEINYKWLDGQLVKTSSKSFEYEGDLTLCGGGGGGAKSGGGGGGSGISMDTSDFSLDLPADPVGNLQDAVTSVTGEDPVGSALEQAEVVLDENTDSFGQAETSINETVAATMDTTQSNIEDTIAANTESWEDLEAGVNTSLDDFHDYGKAANTVVSDELGRWGDYGLKVAGHWGRAMGIGTSNPDDVTIDPDKFAVDSAKKKKNKSDLAVNKAKKRARKSLRIG